MIGELTYNQKGHVESPLSAYQPSQEVKNITVRVKNCYQDGDNLLNTPLREYNNRSIIQRMEEDQMAWLSWTPEPFQGEDDWRWNGVRPITRNKVISTAAHLTAQLIAPRVFAQNDSSEEDRAVANVMQDLIEYNIKNSNYDTAFLYGVISALVNPLSYFKVEYVQGFQEIWQDGQMKKVLDDVYSGFQSSLLAPDDMLFESLYQFNWQKQDWIIEKRGYLSMGQAEAKYGTHSNFEHVKPGKRVLIHDDGNFYDVEDINGDMVEEVVYKCRRKDVEISFVGGIYMGNENANYNPFIHRTNQNKPKYDTVKFGYEPIDSMRFVGYKSLVAKMANDQEAVDREWQMYFDASTLATYPPTITMGAGKIDRSVIAPGTNTELGENAKIQPLQISNPNIALQALREAERSVTESSQDPQLGGTQEGPQKTARESVLLQQNAETNIDLDSKMIAKMVKEVGDLFVDNIIRYQTIGEVSEITGEMAYKTFLLDGKIKGGRNKTSYIKFTDRFAGKKMTKEEMEKEEYKLLDGLEDEKEVYEVNPYPFSRMHYLVQVDADKVGEKNEAFIRAFKLETYDRAITNPLVVNDPEAQLKITRDFLFEPLMKGEAAKYLPNLQKVADQLAPTEEQMEGQGGEGQDLPSRMMRSAAMDQLPANL